MTDRFKNYVSVAERLSEAAPDIAHIETEPPVMMTDAMGYIRARVALKDGCVATGTASFRLDLQGKGAQATNPIEDCETSAVGRALAFLGYSSSRAIATREDVHEAQRREASYQPPRAPSAAQKPAQPATNGDASAADARVKFYEKWGAIAGSHWAAVQGFLTTDQREPTTVDEWRVAYKRVQAEVNQRDIEAIEAAERAA